MMYLNVDKGSYFWDIHIIIDKGPRGINNVTNRLSKYYGLYKNGTHLNAGRSLSICI